MEFGPKLKELNMTADEVDRFATAFKDDTFKGMLLDYAKELSDPENKKKYEEEIKLLEEERGNAIDFIHPQPYRALKTSVDGKQKCFVNICTNDKVGKPEFKWGVSEDGKRGQLWSLPHSLHPGRPERDPKGNKYMIYDVIFHPDTIHMASSNKRYMEMVDSTAIQGIQDGFNVRLDHNNIKVLATRYKGTPQPCVIRKPIPGYKAEDPPATPDPLAFPFPDENQQSAAANKQAAGPKTKQDSKPRSIITESPKSRATTTPVYTLKYRSFIDLQDFRCSRDSAQSPRPKEIVITVDMPLLKSAKDTNLEVLGKSLLVESKKPAYRLELPLAYPVDEDKGEAKFNKQNGQLIIVLPVPPLIQSFDFTDGAGQTDIPVSPQADRPVSPQTDRPVSPQTDRPVSPQTDRPVSPQTDEVEGERKLNDQIKTDVEEDGNDGDVENRTSKIIHQEKLEKEEKEQLSKCTEGGSWDGSEREESMEAREDGVCVTEARAGNPRTDVLTTHYDSCTEVNHCEPAQATVSAELPNPENGNHQMNEVQHVPTASINDQLIQEGFEEAVPVDPVNITEEEMDLDDFPPVQSLPKPCISGRPPQPLLREIDESGKETIISDHSTSAGLSFQNSLLYELD